jgi:asparagine synthase (glutamine-hydrolysing)
MNGYVLIIGQPGQAPSWLSKLRQEPGAGWVRQAVGEGVDVFVQTGPAQCAVLAEGPNLVFGDLQIYGASRPQAVFQTAWDGPMPQARAITRQAWGDYVHVGLPGAYRPLSILRSPSGGLEAVSWARDGVRLVASSLPDWLAPALPPGMAVNWSQVAGVLSNPTLQTANVCLTGLQTLAPGSL